MDNKVLVIMINKIIDLKESYLLEDNFDVTHRRISKIY